MRLLTAADCIRGEPKGIDSGVNKMVNSYNGSPAKLLTPPTLTLVKMTITGHHMVLQSTLSKIA